MYYVISKWQMKPGKEEQFRAAWRRGTDLIREKYGSYGSRLHRDADGRFVGYAEWPDEATWRAAFDASVADADYKADSAKRLQDVDVKSGAEVEALVKKLFATPPDVIRRTVEAIDPTGKVEEIPEDKQGAK